MVGRPECAIPSLAAYWGCSTGGDKMRKRILICLVFGATGLAAALPIGDRLGLSSLQALAGFSAGGVLIGYLVSVFLDVFLSVTTTDN